MNDMESSGDGATGMLEIIDAVADAWARGERSEPEEWLRLHFPRKRLDSRGLATLRTVVLLLRHEVVGLGSPPDPPGAPGVERPRMPELMMSSPSEPSVMSLERMRDDAEWLRANHLEWIGQLAGRGGGMGLLALAWHSGLKQEVVLKVANARHREERFRREIEVHAKLRGHPNIVLARTSLEYHGSPVLVVDYMPGPNLQQRVRGFGPLPWREACDYARQGASGLRHAHSLGVIHRDVKSSNLILSDIDGSVRVLDWGLAIDHGHSLDGDRQLTEPGGFLGTPDYCAPEQAADPAAAGPASDLYGLGCSWYEWLSGDTPFRSHPLGWRQAHANEPVPPLADALGVPPRVERVLRRLLEKEPARRYATAQDFIDDLDRSVRGRSSSMLLVGAALAGAMAIVVAYSRGLRPSERSSPPRPPVVATTEHPPSVVPGGGGAPGSTVSEPAETATSADLSVLDFRIQLLASGGAKERTGTLGEDRKRFAAHEGEEATIHARLSAAGYAYLIAFRPDGGIRLCSPTDESTRPRRSSTVECPASHSEDFYRMEGGPGLIGFAVVASRKPLPEFRTWLADASRSAGPPSWKRVDPELIDPEVIFVWEDGYLLVRKAGESDPIRGGDGGGAVPHRAVARLANWLQRGPGVDVVYANAFAVVRDKKP